MVHPFEKWNHTIIFCHGLIFLDDFPMTAFVPSDADNPTIIFEFSDIVVNSVYGET